ncbi:hypothetical protein BS50DRAFT_326759 [Corynespora cassiicola Philippines]|uniref:SWIM-type domain-containing protein n=1 Tax=Corynespora cassiicola Philippines TaxID=1448308 RepID=A0A2T2NU00_CORCC|nr:hypothetical protein BS50DRAFT_326759 [Corynespora cassiicola Philippines]
MARGKVQVDESQLRRSSRKRKDVHSEDLKGIKPEADAESEAPKQRQKKARTTKNKKTQAKSPARNAPAAVKEESEEEASPPPSRPSAKRKPAAKPKPKQRSWRGSGDGPSYDAYGNDLPEEEVRRLSRPVAKPKPKTNFRNMFPDGVEYNGYGEEIRQREYQVEPPPKFDAKLRRALSQPLQFVQRNRCDDGYAPGETFTIAGNSGKYYRVKIHHVFECSCADFAFRKQSCKHIIYALVKVLKVSEESEVLYQFALTSAELQTIFEDAPQAPYMHIQEGPPDPNRKPIEGDCPICYCEFEEGKEAIVYCKAHCGNNVHLLCMDTWLRSQRQSYGKGTCPYCRQNWVD